MFDNHPLFIVSGTLPENTPLPATVNLAIPEGAQVVWAGEIAGGDVANDPKVEYELLETKDGWDIYALTAKAHRTVQIEANLAAPFQNISGNEGSVNFVYIPATDADELKIGAETPANIVDYDKKPGYEVFGTGGTNGMVYGPQITNAKAGEEYTAAFSFVTMAAGSNAGSSASGDSMTAVIVVLVLLTVAVIGALLVIINRQKSATVPPAKTKTYANTPQRKPAPQAKKKEVPRSKTQSGGGVKWNSPQILIIVIIVVVGIGLLFWASQRNASTVTENNGVFNQVFGIGDPCATVEFNLVPEALNNPKETAEDIFKKIRASEIIVLDASLDSRNGLLIIQYCGSNESEQNIVNFIQSTGYVAGVKSKVLNSPLAQEDGSIVIFASNEPPCMVNSFVIEEPDADSIAFAQKLADAVKNVPDYTGVAYNPSTKIAIFGFCTTATDEMIAEALEAAGIGATLEKEQAQPTADSVLM
jgi:flagellar basal body-associated protein FliL